MMSTYSINIISKSNSPFVSPLIGSSYEVDTANKYRFGLDRQEKDAEVYGDEYEVDFWVGYLMAEFISD